MAEVIVPIVGWIVGAALTFVPLARWSLRNRSRVESQESAVAYAVLWSLLFWPFVWVIAGFMYTVRLLTRWLVRDA